MRVCFLTPALPAPEPVAEYARRLGATLVVTERTPPAAVAGVLPVAEASVAEAWDVAVATEWTGTAHLFGLPAKRHAFWVDHFADRRMGTWQAERFAAALAYDLPVDFLAAAPWVKGALEALRPDARIVLVTTPAPAAPASPPAAAPPSPPASLSAGAALAPDGSAPRPLRVHLARPDEDRAAFSSMSEPAQEVGLHDADVVLMLSTVDGALDAPLRGFLAGATAVVGAAPDADDLVRHGENGFVADADDDRGAARLLDLLARDRDLLARLRGAARETASAWPSWEQATTEMEAALERLIAEDPPPSAAWPIRLMGDAIGGAAVFRHEIATLTNEVHRLQGDDAYRVAVQVRERWRTTRLGPLRRVAAGAARRAKSRLTG